MQFRVLYALYITGLPRAAGGAERREDVEDVDVAYDKQSP